MIAVIIIRIEYCRIIYSVYHIAVVLCAASGAKVGIATPMSVTPMAMIQVPGYRFKDYLRCGGMVNLICMFTGLSSVYFIYYL